MKRLSVRIAAIIVALVSLQGMSLEPGAYETPAIEVKCSDVTAALYSVCLQLHHGDWEVRTKGIEGPSEYVIGLRLSADVGLALRIRLLDGALSTEGSILTVELLSDEDVRLYYESEVEAILQAILREASL